MYTIYISHVASSQQDALSTTSKMLALWLKAVINGHTPASARIWDTRNKRFI